MTIDGTSQFDGALLRVEVEEFQVFTKKNSGSFHIHNDLTHVFHMLLIYVCIVLNCPGTSPRYEDAWTY